MNHFAASESEKHAKQKKNLGLMMILFDSNTTRKALSAALNAPAYRNHWRLNKTRAVMVALALLAGSASACPIPVYQYALEHWKADAYRVIVRHGERNDEPTSRGLEMLREAGKPGNAPVTIVLTTKVDEAHADRAMIELYYPASSRIRRLIWTAPLNEANVRLMLSSPARTALAEMLAKRVSAVWLLLESGDRRLDDEAERTLRGRLARLEQTLVVPDAADWGGTTVQIDSNVNFRVLRVSRDDEAEQVFTRILLNVEPDLEDEIFSGQPIVFPVYGRGLLLYALIGKGINPSTIDTAAAFLTGPCSCQVKSANPGTDLLLEMNWDSRISPTTPAAVGGTVGAGRFLRHFDQAEEEDAQ